MSFRGSFGLLINRLAQPFGPATGELRLAATPPRGRCRARRNAALAGLSCSPNEIDQPLVSILAIALLRAEAPRHDDDRALDGHPPPGEPTQSRLGCCIKTSRASNIEAKLHRGRDLVDVLAAGAAGAHENLLDRVLVDHNTRSDLDHPLDPLPQAGLFIQAIQFDAGEVEARDDPHDLLALDDGQMAITPILH